MVTSPPPPTGNLSAPQPPLPKSSLEDPEFVEGEAIVLLRPGALEAIPTLHERPGLEGFRFELGPWVSPDRAVLIMRPKDEPEGRVSREATRALLPILEAQPEFGAAELNYIRHAQATVDDPLYDFMWHFRQLRMEQAWDIATGSEEVVVAVLDTGIGKHADPYPADILNMSLGGGPPLQADQDAIDAAVAAGPIVVVASGNEDADASRFAFGGNDRVIVVGGTDYLGHRGRYSNWGQGVHVMAPGGDVTVDRNGDGYRDGVLLLALSQYSTGTVYSQGTSYAVPHVSVCLP